MTVISCHKIIHIDMDAYYASVEQRDFPEYRGKAIAVGGSEKRGVVMTASYEARKFGVYSAMASAFAAKKCPHIIFLKPRFDVYKKVSLQIREIFKRYTDLIEPLSLDEAYLDVTQNKKNIPSATLIAKEIKKAIKDELNLTASAGISINKFLAKVASDMNKPDGLTLIPPEKTEEFIDSLPVEKIPGVGKVTEEKMKKLGLISCKELKKLSSIELNNLFGKNGSYFYKIVRNEYDNPVTPNRPRKSISAESTFSEDISDTEVILKELEKINNILTQRIKRINAEGKTITVKIKHFDFTQTTRSKTIKNYIDVDSELFELVKEIIATPNYPEKPVRLLGIGISNLNISEAEINHQLTLEF